MCGDAAQEFLCGRRRGGWGHDLAQRRAEAVDFLNVGPRRFDLTASIGFGLLALHSLLGFDLGSFPNLSLKFLTL